MSFFKSFNRGETINQAINRNNRSTTGMNSESKSPALNRDPQEVVELRRCIRDLVALSALPAVWSDYEPLRIAESLADALHCMMRADLVFVQLKSAEEFPPIMALRTT